MVSFSGPQEQRDRRLIAALLVLTLQGSVALAAWVEFVDETATRLDVLSSIGATDVEEKDYAWGDVDNDGDIDLVIVRKEPVTTSGKRRNVLLLNEDGVLVDRSIEFASDSDVEGDQGFLTPTNDRDVRLVDIDLDGWLDMVTAVTISDGDPKHLGHPRIYRNKGLDAVSEEWLGFRHEDARIPVMLSYTGQSGFNPRFCAVAVGDVTGDGYPDLWFGDYDSGGTSSPQPAGADYNDRLLINEGASNPGFFTDVTASRVLGTVPGINQEFDISAFGAADVIEDINRDGVPDIVKQTSLSTPTYVGVAYNDPNAPGFFDTYDVVNDLSPYFVSVGNLNNDDWPDMVITDDGADRYLLNLGGQPIPDFVSHVFTFSHTGEGGEAGDDGFGGNNLIVDLNDDGWNDVLITDVDVDIAGCLRRTHIYRNLGGPPGGYVNLQEQTSGAACQNLFGNPASCVVTGIPSDKLLGTHDIAVFDIDGDGRKDMVVGRCTGTEVYINQAPAPLGGVPDGNTVPGPPLVVDKGTNGKITLSWGPSCSPDDTDFAIYEGTLGDFQSHVPKTCLVGGALSRTFVAGPGSTYYLVVPHTFDFEGGYGFSSSGPRTQGPSACYPPAGGSCN